uniref:Uncharacterized protein n=1 Tax=Anguilla anguilla TaxID=7936 RepID=A0A0E9PCS9_ANGAN
MSSCIVCHQCVYLHTHYNLNRLEPDLYIMVIHHLMIIKSNQQGQSSAYLHTFPVLPCSKVKSQLRMHRAGNLYFKF